MYKWNNLLYRLQKVKKKNIFLDLTSIVTSTTRSKESIIPTHANIHFIQTMLLMFFLVFYLISYHWYPLGVGLMCKRIKKKKKMLKLVQRLLPFYFSYAFRNRTIYLYLRILYLQNVWYNNDFVFVNVCVDKVHKYLFV